MSALNSKDVIRYMLAKQPNGKCVSCGNTSFDIVNEQNTDQNGLEGRAALTIFPFPDYDIMKAKSMDVVVLGCTNCATLRFLTRKMVAEWVDGNPAPVTH
jgi:ferredoxin-like protein FixX